MNVTCTIEEADRCGICDNVGLGEHAVFRSDGRIIFVLCLECLGRAVVAKASRVWPAYQRGLLKAARKREKDLTPITAKEVMVLFGDHWTTGKGVRVDTFSRAVARFVAKRWSMAVANGTLVALVSSMTREIRRDVALAGLLTAVEHFRVALGPYARCTEKHTPEERCPTCDLDRAVATLGKERGQPE